MSRSVIEQIRSELVAGVPRYEQRRRKTSIATVAALLVVVVGASGVVWTARHERKSHVTVRPDVTRPLPLGPLAGLHQIPSPPGGASLPARPVWTGEHFLSVGATDEEGTLAAFSYDVENRAWRKLAPPPVAISSGSASAWTGTELVVCCGAVPNNSAAAAAYDPDTGRWRTLPDAPVHGYATAAWTGDSVVVATSDGVAAFDPATDRWNSLPRPANLQSFNKVVWTGEDLIVWPAPGSRSTWLGERFDPEANTWTPLPDLPVRSWPAMPDVVALDGSLVVLGGLPAAGATSQRFVASRYDTATDRWVSLPEPLPEPAPGEGNLGSHTSLWTGEDLLVWAGEIASGASSNGALMTYDPKVNSWRLVGKTSATALRPLAMADDRVLFEGGRNFYLSDPGWRPSTAAVSSGPPPWNAVPLETGPLPLPDNAAIAATASDLFVWGGNDISTGLDVATGRRYDLQTGRSRALPPSPLAAREGALAAGNSSGVVVVGGYDVNSRALSDAARFDPQRNAWSRLPSLPAGTVAQDLYAAGDVLYVSGRSAQGDNATSSVWRLAPDAAAWTEVPLPSEARSSDAVQVSALIAGGLILAATAQVSLEPGRERLGQTRFWTSFSNAPSPDWQAQGATPEGIEARDFLVHDGRLVVVWDGGAQRVPESGPVPQENQLLYRDADEEQWHEVTLPLSEQECSPAVERVADAYVVWNCSLETAASADLETWRAVPWPGDAVGLHAAPTFGAQQYFVYGDYADGASPVYHLGRLTP